MIGRADIEGSKSNVTMNAWLPQASYPCGPFSDLMTKTNQKTIIICAEEGVERPCSVIQCSCSKNQGKQVLAS
ncbi:hypothetical protein DUNSADRAFT_10176 [Dunaliella salina]|uniref:Uncharacterized protein n=1 Tax=Dunaliella salina TaxID=3046 RepID=A0ABQ7GFZ3_DUNSA|nr:hypothetical protein DUNSADRAFT_10176 [Dunaliella salina]|eukprot:KAF5833525.1 hypothetical protein DUNSADRAFT_10176 [Dunaliella salina]